MTKKGLILLILLSLSTLSAEKLTLGEVEKTAAANSFSVQSKIHEEKIKKWEKYNAYSGYMPSVDYKFNYLHMGMDEKILEMANQYAMGPNRMYKNSVSHEISITQPITNGGAEIFAIKIAEYVENAFKFDQQETMELSILNARKIYFDLMAVREMRKISEKNIEWIMKNLESTRVKLEAGGSIKIDLLRWNSELLKANDTLKMFKNNEKVLFYSLYHAMGKKVSATEFDRELMSLDEVVTLFENSRIDIEGSIDSSATIKGLREGIKISEGAKKLSFTQFMPKVNAFFTQSWPVIDSLKPNTEDDYWTAGISISVPIFSGFRNYTSYRKAKFEHIKALSDEIEVRNNLLIAKEQLKLEYDRLKATAVTAKKQIELAEIQLEALKQRYEAGGVKQSLLLETALLVDNAKYSYISALFETLKTEAEYHKITGNLEVKR